MRVLAAVLLSLVLSGCLVSGPAPGPQAALPDHQDAGVPELDSGPPTPDATPDVTPPPDDTGPLDAQPEVGLDAATPTDVLPDGESDACEDVGQGEDVANPPDVAGPVDVSPGDPDTADSGPPPCIPADEACNDLDDDCDGLVDEGLNLGEVCVVGSGWYCERRGTIVCDPEGAAVCSAARGELPVHPEACNGRDDDCDGETDEGCVGECVDGDRDGYGVGPGCDGLQDCDDNDRGTFPGNPDERCDGKDTDCDGELDEYFGVGTGELCPAMGECPAGPKECESGVPAWAARGRCVTWPGGSQDASHPEICDGLDNDCDQQTDENGVCP